MRRRTAASVRRLLCLTAVLPLAACVHTVNPRVTPEKLAVVTPPIERRALLLLTPSFTEHVAQMQMGLDRYDYQMGTSASRALTDMVTNSFREAETRVVTDAEALRYMTAPVDSTTADVILVPRFESGTRAFERIADLGVEAAVRLDVRASQRGTAYSWVGLGRTVRMFSSKRGLSGNTLEEALNALSDSLRVNRELL